MIAQTKGQERTPLNNYGYMFHKLDSWAKTVQGRPISLFSSLPLHHLKRGSVQKQLLFFIGGIHGDEPEGIFLTHALLEWLKTHHKIIQNEWILIPCLNVDGAARNSRTNSRGVDLNRNFPSQDWNPQYKEERYFPGREKASEAEVQALCYLIQDLQPHLILHFHSWQPAIILSGPPQHPAAFELSNCSQYPLQIDIGYPTPGSLGQWAGFDLGLPVICIEEREGANKNETWTRFGPGLQKILGIEGSF